MTPASHLLDCPIWNALTTRQAALALGGPLALRYLLDIGAFAAAADASDRSLADLVALVPPKGPLVLIQADVPPPMGGITAQTMSLSQMVATAICAPQGAVPCITALTEDDAPQMLALATLTEPGPFLARTHQLGDFFGVKIDGALVAMAGERMRLSGHREVSAVCTHPGHRGHGYAAHLTAQVAARVVSRGETPFLHVFPHNIGAIRVYESLGFVLRRGMKVTLLTRTATIGS